MHTRPGFRHVAGQVRHSWKTCPAIGHADDSVEQSYTIIGIDVENVHNGSKILHMHDLLPELHKLTTLACYFFSTEEEPSVASSAEVSLTSGGGKHRARGKPTWIHKAIDHVFSIRTTYIYECISKYSCFFF